MRRGLLGPPFWGGRLGRGGGGCRRACASTPPDPGLVESGPYWRISLCWSGDFCCGNGLVMAAAGTDFGPPLLKGEKLRATYAEGNCRSSNRDFSTARPGPPLCKGGKGFRSDWTRPLGLDPPWPPLCKGGKGFRSDWPRPLGLDPPWPPPPPFAKGGLRSDWPRPLGLEPPGPPRCKGGKGLSLEGCFDRITGG